MATTILKKYWNKTITKTTSTPTRHQERYQPGGTLSIIGNRWTGGTRAYEDSGGMGRWSELHIQGRQNRKVIIITTYRVPHTNIANAGPNTSYYHQWHYLRRTGLLKPDPRKQLLLDLSEHIRSLTSPDNAIIILMDANEAYTDKNSDLHKWMTQHSFNDVHMHLHQHDTTIPTYSRGHKRIDYILATDNILPYMQKSGILPFHFLLHTDHRALYVEIDLQKYLRSQPSTLSNQQLRSLTSKSPRGAV